MPLSPYMLQIRSLRQIPGKSMASWALRYVAGFDNVKVILSGMSNEEQLEDNLSTFSPYVPFTDHEKVALDAAITALKARPNNGCTGCKYCLPCASGVEIPRVFRVWNDFQRYQNEDAALRIMASSRAWPRAELYPLRHVRGALPAGHKDTQ